VESPPSTSTTLPPGTPLSRTDFLRKGFLRDCRGRAYQPLQRDEPAQTRF